MDKQKASQQIQTAFGLITGPNVRGWSANEYEQAKALLNQVIDWLNKPEAKPEEPK